MRARTVSHETLDGLLPDDPRARRSRRDLLRVNRIMGAPRILAGVIEPLLAARARERPLAILELGAGDGRLLARVAIRLARWRRTVELTLLDRLALLEEQTRAGYERAGWRVQVLARDVLEWARIDAGTERYDLIVTNLFLHHFTDACLEQLMRAVAARCDLFFACEPRRTALPLLGSHLLGFIGASRVTREDGVLSVRAGFRDQELSALWPAPRETWRLLETDAGAFSHVFRAARQRVATGHTGADPAHRPAER